MNRPSFSDKLLLASEHLFPITVVCCDLAIWLLLVPGRLVTAL